MVADETPWEVARPAGATLGEGPVWVDGRLWWVDIEEGRIHHTDVSGGVGADTTLELGEPVGSVTPRAEGGFVAGMRDGVAWFDADGIETRRIAIEADVSESRMNDGKAGPDGCLYTGTYISGQRRSALYRIDPDGAVRTVFTGVGNSNGLGWSAAGDRFFYIDTATRRVDVCDFDPDTGEVAGRRSLIEVTDESWGRPDGMCVDAEDHLWVAFWAGGCVRRFDPRGTLVREVRLPVTQTTSCAFGGPDLDRMFVTSAARGLDAEQRRAQPLAGALFEIDPGVRGRPAARFAG